MLSWPDALAPPAAAGKSVTPRQLKAARALADVSQQDLADSAGISRSVVARFELRRRRPGTPVLRQLQLVLESRGVQFVPGGVVLADTQWTARQRAGTDCSDFR